jgi:hypothetical protein
VGNLPYGSNTILVLVLAVFAYTEYWKIWIDYNQNGTFETSEEIVTGSSSSSANLTSTFTVSTSALAGTTRMRVSMKYNAAQTACESFSYGEWKTCQYWWCSITSITTAKTGIDLGNENQFQMY